MKIVIYVFLALIPFQVFADEKAEDATKFVTEMMVVAKATGMCGVFHQMTVFQESTKMPGGNEFILRFLNTEAARLGHTTESFLKQCKDVVEKYNSNMALLESSK